MAIYPASSAVVTVQRRSCTLMAFRFLSHASLDHHGKETEHLESRSFGDMSAVQPVYREQLPLMFDAASEPPLSSVSRPHP